MTEVNQQAASTRMPGGELAAMAAGAAVEVMVLGTAYALWQSGESGRAGAAILLATYVLDCTELQAERGRTRQEKHYADAAMERVRGFTGTTARERAELWFAGVVGTAIEGVGAAALLPLAAKTWYKKCAGE